MFGDQGQDQSMGAVAMPVSDPYAQTSPTLNIQQMHQDAVSASQAQQSVLSMADSTPMAAPEPPVYADPVTTSTPEPQVATPASAAPLSDQSELVEIKQQALNALSPLVGSLEQSAEEKFKTTMMMIQASDDRTLVKAAYEAAQAIEDEKARAQALLDVVNEINYFLTR